MSEEPDSAATAIGEYSSVGRAHEHALVVLAMDLSCWLVQGNNPQRVILLAEEPDVAAITAEISIYERERLEEQNRPKPVELPRFAPGQWLALLWAIILMAVLSAQGHHPDLEARYLSSSHGLFENGEWWRPFTALFLHGDVIHMMSNILFGVIFATLSCMVLGRLLAWGLILGAGVLGNIITAAVHYPDSHLSLGASTSVFGALGIITAYGMYLAFRFPANSPWKSMLVPIGGGLAMLGMHGAGGGNTDVLAHLFGFLAGALLGLVASWWRLRQAAVKR